MNPGDLKRFEEGIWLSQAGRRDEAHAQLKNLLGAYPDDFNLLLWTAFTSSDLTEAQRLVAAAKAKEPENNNVKLAQNWLKEQEKQRLGKRFRGNINGGFAPPVPVELKQPAPVMAMNANQPRMASAPVAAQTGNSGTGRAITPVVPTPSQTVVPANPNNKPVIKPLVVEIKATKFRKPKTGLRWWQKILIGLVVLLVAAGGLMLVPPVRDFVFNTGPLSVAEQSYVNDLTQINDTATLQINSAYSCLLSSTPQSCIIAGYTTAYVKLGEVRDRFMSLKSPSGRFDKVHAMLASAYSSMGSASAFAFETISQKRYTNNLSEMLTRLDSGRKLLEQGKADLKTLLASFSKR